MPPDLREEREPPEHQDHLGSQDLPDPLEQQEAVAPEDFLALQGPRDNQANQVNQVHRVHPAKQDVLVHWEQPEDRDLLDPWVPLDLLVSADNQVAQAHLDLKVLQEALGLVVPLALQALPEAQA